ncbi:MAG TPA: DUF58 domain-containing protein [Gallionella sp.]|nr:DUF58 domain-containing protein [Gallionella sp.]
MIVPDLEELSALRGAAQGLSLRARRPAMAQLQGGHRSAQRGRGLEFEEVRLYTAGDDSRNIDWRVTARRGRTHTKLFREERERPVWLVADIHPGLYFGSRRQFKSSVLLRAAAMLSWAAAIGGDRVGAVISVAGSQPLILPPRAREAGVLPILQALVESQPTGPGMPAPDGLRNAVSALRPLLQPGSLVLLLSDFAELDSATADMLASASLHNDCRLLWITDPLESSGLPSGNYRVGLPDRIWWMDGDQSRTSWQQSWQAREQRLDDLATRLNLPLHRLGTQDPVTERMISLLREPAWAA